MTDINIICDVIIGCTIYHLAMDLIRLFIKLWEITKEESE